MEVHIVLQSSPRYDLSLQYQNSFKVDRYKLLMSDPEAHYILKSRPAKQREKSLFACMECYPDDSEADSKSLSSTYSRRHLNNNSIQQPHASSDRLSQQVYLKASELMESRKSTNPRGEKISIKNRRSSNFQRQSIIFPERQNIPSHLTSIHQPTFYRQPETARSSISSLRCSNLDGTVANSINSVMHSNTGLRSPVPTVAFTYQKGPTTNLSLPVVQTNALISPQKLNLSSYDQIGPSPNETTPRLTKLNPKVAISKSIEQQSPLINSEYLQHIPESPFRPLKLQFQQKSISDLFNQKDREIYNSLQSIPHLSKHGSSNGSEPPVIRKKQSLGHNFGNVQGKLKVRQTVSIKQPEEEDVHQSIVIEKSGKGNLLGLLNPINESDEFGNAMGGTLLWHRRGCAPQQMHDDQF